MKTIITIEREDLEIDGVPHVKRIVKENEIIVREDIITLSVMSVIDTPLSTFLNWIEYLKNPTYNENDSAEGTIKGRRK